MLAINCYTADLSKYLGLDSKQESRWGSKPSRYLITRIILIRSKCRFKESLLQIIFLEGPSGMRKKYVEIMDLPKMKSCRHE